MNPPMTPHRDRDRWSAPAERVMIIVCLTIVLLAVVGALVVLGVHHDIDKAGLTAVLGTVGGGVVTALAHKMGQRG